MAARGHFHSRSFQKKNMFDFEKLEVYKKAKAFNADIRQFLKETKLDPTTNDQLRRALFSIVLNLAASVGQSLWRRTKGQEDSAKLIE